MPCSFKPWITNDEDVSAIADHLAATVAYLAALRDDTGKEIHLGLEPEPDCYLETTEETIRFFNEVLLVSGAAEVGRLLGCGPEQAEKLIRRHIGVCLDTCHLFAAGYDLRDETTYQKTIALFRRLIGFDRLKCFHLNDAKFELGSRRDRHERVGKGKIGKEAFRHIVNDPRFRNRPMVLETPKVEGDNEDMDAHNLTTLRDLLREP